MEPSWHTAQRTASSPGRGAPRLEDWVRAAVTIGEGEQATGCVHDASQDRQCGVDATYAGSREDWFLRDDLA
ncbi:hypothetical protein K3495_g1908 [Podosphaera aphanis]|nr:hypothetical protein K3495_g1908 [Podosphaera aphanis]